MKNFIRIISILLALQVFDVQADGLSCLLFEAETDQPITPDDTCAIVTESTKKYFQDLTFIKHEKVLGTTCYSGSFTGHLGGIEGKPNSGTKIEGSFVNGLTSIENDYSSASAASIYTFVTPGGKKIGKLLTQEVILNLFVPEQTSEYGIGVGGTRLLNKGMANFRVIGNAILGPVQIKGTVCMETDKADIFATLNK